MKPTQVFTKWVIPSCLLILAGLFMPINQAHAGGYDDFDSLTAEEQMSRLRTLPAVLSWEKWEKPYVSGGDLCRYKNGDVVCLSICLSTDMAKKVGAHIYSPKKPIPSPTAKRK
ncbi:hypothetical protein FJR11_21000 [Anabaena sp. UHCC 0187]|uniref:hypothetical protein n=1 Tax=Anabaena sp. UHCC 0187 TaxID=2590018 RepID=UPI0014460A88|nr:hypothetical protein [Anabaena sp. UHCC 0187]MDP5016856.1 hypothetical protein [Dolichospermum sp.]MTJ15007.1 hypothetical protein [Anabaena sp. UHCC 0187]